LDAAGTAALLKEGMAARATRECRQDGSAPDAGEKPALPSMTDH